MTDHYTGLMTFEEFDQAVQDLAKTTPLIRILAEQGSPWHAWPEGSAIKNDLYRRIGARPVSAFAQTEEAERHD